MFKTEMVQNVTLYSNMMLYAQDTSGMKTEKQVIAIASREKKWGMKVGEIGNINIYTHI